jgi:hypothetical protein
MTALAMALDYAARGFAVFPLLEKRKEPATSRGFKDATTNPATIRRWFGSQHNYNIAIRTGLASAVWVLDMDSSNGAFALAELEAKHGPLPLTMTSVGESGTHLWFKMDGPLQCSVSRVGHGLDVRADGGYAVAPPSVHPDGPTYRWTNDRPPAIAPEWLVKLAKQRPGAPKIIIPEATCRRQGSPGAYGQAALEYEVEVLTKTAPGGRNHALNRASFSLHQLVAGGELDGAEVRQRLIEAATANGLMTDPTDGPRSVEQTIASGVRAGLQFPRQRKERI